MNANFIYILVVYFVFGIGAGCRFLFFKLIGKKVVYNDLIEPKSQDKWNILISLIIAFALVFLIFKYDVFLKSRHAPIEQLMMRKHVFK